jgi:hypothetical protein
MGYSAAKAAQIEAEAHQGEIRSDTVPSLFHEIHVQKATGILTVSDWEIRKTIHVRDGRVLFAGSSSREDRLSQLLLRENAISLVEVLKALEIGLSTKDRLGEVVVKRQVMTQDVIDKWVRIQVQEIIYSTFHWTQGRFRFDEGPACDERLTIDLSGDAVVAEGIRRMRSWARAYEQIGGLNAEYRTTRDMPAIIKDLPIRPEEIQLLDMCDQTTTLGEMCMASALSDLEVCHSVWWLFVVGALMKS